MHRVVLRRDMVLYIKTCKKKGARDASRAPFGATEAVFVVPTLPVVYFESRTYISNKTLVSF
jgi:hypothetical protein